MEPKVIDYSSAFLKLNISGTRYKILRKTAFSMPDSLFAELAHLDYNEHSLKKLNFERRLTPAAAMSFYMIDTNEFYFERSSTVFDYVLHYVYTGRLHCPNGVCRDMLAEELQFWRIVTNENFHHVKVASCCIQDGDKKSEDDDWKSVDALATNDHDIAVVNDQKRPGTLRGRVWICCEDPSSSTTAAVINIISILFIIVSIVNLILSTVKSLQHCKVSDETEKHYDDVVNETSLNITESTKSKCEGGPIFDLIEIICIGWFTLELVVRFIACPKKWKFFKSGLNIIDILSTVPFYIELIIRALNLNNKIPLVVYVFRLLRIIRITRALRLARYVDSIRIMGEVFQKCKKDLSLLLAFILMATIISSSVMYYFERDEENTHFTSIPATFWWCVVTLTTVGYGDMYPTTWMGRVFASVVCVMGIILMAMPISIMVEQFSQTYKNRHTKARRAHLRTLFKNALIYSKHDHWKHEEDSKFI